MFESDNMLIKDTVGGVNETFS